MGYVVHNTYTTGTRALTDIYARALGPAVLGLVRIYQAKHSSLWYKYNIYQSCVSIIMNVLALLALLWFSGKIVQAFVKLKL